MDLEPLIERHGDEPMQRLTKPHVDELVTDLLAGGTRTGKGRTGGSGARSPLRQLQWS
jgi:integrase